MNDTPNFHPTKRESAASSAPTPLYHLYQEGLHFSAGMLTLIFGYPHCIEAKSRIFRGYTFYCAKYLAGVNRQLVVMAQLTFAAGHAH